MSQSETNTSKRRELTFGENLARLMGMHRIKVRDARDAMGVSPTAVSEWSSGKRTPQIATALQIAEFFEVPGDALVAEDFAGLLAAGAGGSARFSRIEAKLAPGRQPSFGDNVMRLMGLHRLKIGDAKDTMAISPTAVSEWHRSKRKPQVETMLRVAEFFELPGHELVSADFAHLLDAGAGDPERFRRVELKIARARRPLRSVSAPG